MKRRHLFEFEDQPWLPRTFRNFITDALRFMLELTDVYVPAIPIICEALSVTGSDQVLDLCSGGGGPLLRLHDRLQKQCDHKLKVILTDKFPNLDAFESIKQRSNGCIDFVPEGTDVLNVPSKLGGVRTLFSCLHHFRPSEVEAIFADAVSKNKAICIFEVANRSPISTIKIILSAILLPIAMPFVRPFSWLRLFFTYIVPVAPLLIFWDGLASTLRLYTPAELKAMAVKAGPGYHWEAGLRSAPYANQIVYLTGYPPRVGK
jgi:hypothetical protein